MLGPYLTKEGPLIFVFSVYGSTLPELTSLKCVNVSPTNPSGRTYGKVTRGRVGRVTHFQVSCGITGFQIDGVTGSLILNNVVIFWLYALKISFFLVAIFASRLFTHVKTFVLRSSSTRYFRGVYQTWSHGFCQQIYILATPTWWLNFIQAKFMHA